MKHTTFAVFFSTFCLYLTLQSSAQTGVSINSTGAAPNANAILDISSSTKGALLPRMTSVERLAFVPTGLSGMTVYDTTTQTYWYWDGTVNQWRQLANMASIVHSTLDGAYDQGGAGAGRVIMSDAGAVDIQGAGGLLVNGSVGIGASGTDKLHVQTTGGNTSVRIGYSPSYVDNLVYFGEGTDVYVGEKGLDDRLYLYGRSLSVDINGDLGTSGSVLKSNGSTVSWQPDLGLTGTGTLNYLARWTGASTLGIGATFDNGTNVGIGTATPYAKLNVGDPNGPSVYLTREDATTLANDVLGSLLFDSTDDTSPSTTDASAGIRGHAAQDHGNSTKGGYMTFFTKNNIGNAGSASERMRIAANGNIGIGTSTPSAQLHTTGTVRFENLTGVGTRMVVADAAGLVSTQTLTAPPSGPAGGDLSGTYPNPQVVDDSHNHTELEAKPQYSWNAANAPNTYPDAVTASFVSATEGFPSYGSVLNVRTYPNDGGALQLYAPYNAAYGGSSLRYRLGLYNNAGWSSWKTIWDDTNDGTGSGMDADLLDGLNGASYLDNTDNQTLSVGGGNLSISGGNSVSLTSLNIGDNLGNHTASSYLQMGTQWINFAANAGLYSTTLGNHFYPADANYWYMRSDRGMRVLNNAGTSMGYLYHDNGSSFGLLSPSGSWRLRVDNSNTEAYGGFYAGTSYQTIVYDRDNTGYYSDPASTSNVNAMVSYSYQGNGNVGGTGSASWHPSGIYSAGYNWLYGGINGGGGSATNFGDVRANIFYDYNNTSFYVDPASGSVLRGTLTLHDDGAPSPLFDIRADDTSPWAIRLYNDAWGTGPQIYASATDQIYTSGYWRGGTGLCIGGDCRTSWANAGDNLGNHSATTTLQMNNNYINGYGRLEPYGVGGNSGQGAHSYAIHQESGGWSSPYPDLRLAFHTGIKLGAHFSYNGIRFYNNSDMVTQTMSVGDGDNNVRIYYDISTVGDIFSTQNYGKGLVGLYASTRYQNVFSMGAAYRLAADGTTTGNLYGIAWTHSNVGGASISGLGHQALFMSNGDTRSVVGDGIWSKYTSYLPFIYDQQNTGYYWDGNSTSRMYYGDFNYLHTTNDSWFPYTGNNWNYFRGNSYVTNAHWYDENNSGYYFNLDNTNRIATVYHGIGAYNVSGWLSGIMQTENTSDGHQYNPLTGNWGYVGTSGQYWYYSYASSHVNVSRRELKRDIQPLDESLSEFMMDDIDKMKPSLYKFNDETDEYQEGNEPKYRPNMRLGLILDEAPDYLQDQAFAGVDIYSLATLGIAGVKHNREEIKKLKEGVGTTKINDFGSARLEGETIWVRFDQTFSSQLINGEIPVISVTPGELGAEMAVVEKSKDGFRVRKVGTNPLDFDWIAMAKVKKNKPEPVENTITPELMSQLRVDESRKAPIKAYWKEAMLKSQTEHARQAEEHTQTVEHGKSNYMETINATPENPISDPGPGPYTGEDSSRKPYAPRDVVAPDADIFPVPQPIDPNYPRDDEFWKTDLLVNPEYLKTIQTEESEKQKLDILEYQKSKKQECEPCAEEINKQ